jgi:multiple sugar transport system permease protein
VTNTLVFAAIKVPLAVIVPLLLALILNREFPGRLWPLVAFVSPNFCASAGLMLVWLWMLDSRLGLVNYYLLRFGLLKEPVGWFTSATTAWMWIISITIWWISGFFVLLYLSALQKIPAEQYEAAMIDGAGSWTRFIHITLPWIRNVMFFIVAYQVILAFGLFDQVYFLTQGGPVGRTRTIVYYIYMTGFQRQQFGRAAAISWLMFVLVILFGLFQLMLLTRSVKPAEE